MLLPISDTRRVRRTGVRLMHHHAPALVAVIGLHGAAAICGLAAPWLIGRLIDAITLGDADLGYVDLMLGVLVAAVVVQAVMTRFAQFRSLVLGEEVFAALREEFMGTVGHLPLSTVERAGTGDLLARTTNDIDAVAQIVRFGIPRVLVTGMTALLTIVAALATHPLVAVAVFVGVPLLVLSSKWYLRRSGPGYQRQLASYARLGGVVNETVEGARTVDALDLGPMQRSKVDRALGERYDAERYTLRLRSVWYPWTTLGFLLPVVVVLGWGAFLIEWDAATAGAVAAVALYAMQLNAPVDELMNWVDKLQVGTTALSRIIGVGEVPPDRTASGETPRGEQLRARGVRHEYRRGIEVLHGIDLDLRVGERLAIVGPSGSGKSTLARLLTGITEPTGGTVTVGGVRLVDLPVEELRRHVALVTQEHHIFVGTIAENLRLAAADASLDDLEAALAVVGALAWVRSMPEGFDTPVGSGGVVLTPAQAQQLALARLVLLDPHTLVLDEATSLLDPRAARELESSLDRVLQGRTVVAIAHRLHTAHDADRVAVVQAGRVVELGSHDELVALGGEYAALWTSWHGDAAGHA